MFTKVAERHLVVQARPAMSRADFRKVGERVLRQRMTILLGGMSVFMYTLLYFFSADLIQLAQITHQGNHHYFYVPVVIALVFSFVHGAFTSHFWDMMGIKPKQQA